MNSSAKISTDCSHQEISCKNVSQNRTENNKGVKRKREFEELPALKKHSGERKLHHSVTNNSHQFSANNRLKNYRSKLEEQKACKPHTLQPIEKSSTNSLSKTSNKPDLAPAGANSQLFKNDQFSRSDNKIRRPTSIQGRLSAFKYYRPETSNGCPSGTQTAVLYNKDEPKNVDNTKNLFLDRNSLCVNTIRSSNEFSSSVQDHNKYDSQEMEWNDIDDTEVLSNIGMLRQSFDEVAQHKTTFKDSIIKNTEELPNNTSVFKDTYIVVDTNIFLTHLDVVRRLLNIKINDVVQPIVYIPWVVVQELDYIKDGRSGTVKLQSNARMAVNFIYQNLQFNKSYFKGQSVMDATQHCIQSCSPDDGILSCCLQIVEKGNRPILLSNDKNLCNKALMSNIPAYSHDTITKQLCPSEESSAKQKEQTEILQRSTRITAHLSHLFSFIILDKTKAEFGEYLGKMALLKSPPWTLSECLYRFEKLWISVFSTYLQKNFLKAVQDFKFFLGEHHAVSKKDDLQKFVNYALTCCIYLKNAFSSQYPDVTNCINNIQNLTFDL